MTRQYHTKGNKGKGHRHVRIVTLCISKALNHLENQKNTPNTSSTTKSYSSTLVEDVQGVVITCAHR
jgi:hypothetical protein